MSTHPNRELEIVLSSGGQFYAIIGAGRECGFWLSLTKRPLPVPVEWHRPGTTFAAVMRGRDYWRIGAAAPQFSDSTKAIAAGDELVKDYLDACWWTPGLEEAWVEAQGLGEAIARATKPTAELKPEPPATKPESGKKKGEKK